MTVGGGSGWGMRPMRGGFWGKFRMLFRHTHLEGGKTNSFSHIKPHRELAEADYKATLSAACNNVDRHWQCKDYIVKYSLFCFSFSFLPWLGLCRLGLGAIDETTRNHKNIYLSLSMFRGAFNGGRNLIDLNRQTNDGLDYRSDEK